MFSQKWPLISALGSLTLLPLIAVNVPVDIIHINPAIVVSARVVTATRPLDLASTSLSDFGDLDATHAQ